MKEDNFLILVVDDSPVFTKILSNIINKNSDNVTVRVANSGMEGVRILGNNKIDLIILDVFMPNFDGIEMAKIIRANPLTSRIPIIFISGSESEVELVQKALDIGGVDFLNKSFSEQEIARMINLYLRFLNWERKINVELQDKITELNSEISKRIEVEKALVKTANKLAEANSTKDKFFSIIAHDLKNPLISFQNLSETLIADFQEMEDHELLEFFLLLRNSSANLYSLLDNLLTWSRAQSGVIKAKFSEFNLMECVNQIITVLEDTAKEKKITLNVGISEDIVVYADMNMIMTVIRNLISNSIKFTPFAGNVTISAFKTENNTIYVGVRDTGIGMSDDEITSLFVNGKSMTKLGTNMEKGTGLGLSISYEFIKLNNSKLKVKSKEGEGSEFYFELDTKIN